MDDKILQALVARLASMAGEMPLSLPNTTTSPAPARPFLRASFIPAAAQAATINVDEGSANVHRGLFQVDVVVDKDAGLLDVQQRATMVQAQFRRGLLMRQDNVVVRIDQPPRVAQGLLDDVEFFVPVTIPYTAFISNQ